MATGIVYDEKMCLHEKQNHPEQPDRRRSIYTAMNNIGLLDQCKIIPIRCATDDEILSVHSNEHLAEMKKLSALKNRELEKAANKYNSIYFNKHTYGSALLSAGGVVELCDRVVKGNLTNGIAIVRPPGHHAECHTPMGFCIFNNVAIAAASMINKYNLKRIVIFDWDVHHGNATQHMFESDPRVLYISIHRYDNGYFYPGSPDAAPSMVGKGKGKGIGKNVNIALNTTIRDRHMIGDADYIFAYNDIVKHMIAEYNPELIIISAGFDCAEGDPLGDLHVTPACFNYMVRDLMAYANGKIVIALEGGYNLTAISESMIACLKALLKYEPMKIICNDKISDIAIDAVNATAFYHRLHWQFLKKYYQ